MARRVYLVVALVLAGCGGHRPDAPSTAARAPAVKLVPFDGSTPAALAVPAPVPAAACRAADLRVDANGLQLVPGTQEGGTGGFVLRNRGPRPCRLTGRPELRFVGGTAPPRQTQRALDPDPPAFPKLTPDDRVLLALPPGRGAILSLDWDNWCPQAKSAARFEPPKALRVTLPHGGGSLDVPYSAVVTCVHPDQPSVLAVRPFVPQPLEDAKAFTAAPMTVKLHPLDGGKGTLHGRRGQELRFAVELTNGSATETVAFDRCPLVAEKFAPVGATEAHQLNCGAAGTIRPKGVRFFEMRVHVPADAPLGANGLFWRLDPTGEAGPQTVARVVVDR